MMTKYTFLVFACLFYVIQSFAQDIHFAQVGNSPLNLNPALTGVFEGDVRILGNYRSQWNSAPVEYETFSVAADMSFINENYEQQFFSAGIMFNNDTKGDARLNLSNLSLSGSFTRRVGKGHYMTAGLMGAFSQRSFDISGLRFDNQYSTEIRQFDPKLSSLESFENDNKMLFDISVGLNWHYRVPKVNKRTSFDFGLGIMHLNTPIWSFQDQDEQRLPIRWNPYFFGTFQVTNKLDIQVQAIYQEQNPHRAYMIGPGVQIHLDQDYDEEKALQLAVNFRLNDRIEDTRVISEDVVDAIVPMIGMRYRMLRGMFSYDINISDFRTASNRRGGPEFSLVYIFTRVKPTATKICPIYL